MTGGSGRPGGNAPRPGPAEIRGHTALDIADFLEMEPFLRAPVRRDMNRCTYPVLYAYSRNGNCKIVVTTSGTHLNEEGLASMEIRFISSLTSEDEDLFAPAVLKAVSALLDQLPIAYTIRIETTGSHAYEHTHVAPDLDAATDPLRRAEAISHLVRGPHIG